MTDRMQSTESLLYQAFEDLGPKATTANIHRVTGLARNTIESAMPRMGYTKDRPYNGTWVALNDPLEGLQDPLVAALDRVAEAIIKRSTPAPVLAEPRPFAWKMPEPLSVFENDGRRYMVIEYSGDEVKDVEILRARDAYNEAQTLEKAHAFTSLLLSKLVAAEVQS